AVLDAGANVVGLDVVYLVVGKMTARLARLGVGAVVDVWGPLGNGFPALSGRHVALVAGGIGQTPFLAHVRELLGTRGYGGKAPRRQGERGAFFFGGRAAGRAAGGGDFRAAGARGPPGPRRGTPPHPRSRVGAPGAHPPP